MKPFCLGLAAFVLASTNALAASPTSSSTSPAAPVPAAYQEFTASPLAGPALQNALDGLLSEADLLFAKGIYAAALRPYYQALDATRSLGEVRSAAFIHYRIGAANWALFRDLNEPAYGELSILHWEAERAVYASGDYYRPVVAAASYGLGRAYLALATAAPGDPMMRRAAEAFAAASAGLTPVELEHTVAHIGQSVLSY